MGASLPKSDDSTSVVRVRIHARSNFDRSINAVCKQTLKAICKPVGQAERDAKEKCDSNDGKDRKSNEMHVIAVRFVR